MSTIAIYVEGGGEGRNGRAALRQGLDAFLDEQKRAALSHGWRWKLVCAGSRSAAFKAFRIAIQQGDTEAVLLLVDAEGPLQDGAIAHLRRRDGWNMDFAEERAVHLMVQTMESWIVADGDALAAYYGNGFHRNSLPKSTNLESVPSREIERSLKAATRHTAKGEYHKIRHARPLLAQISQRRVRERCEGCGRFLDYLTLILT